MGIKLSNKLSPSYRRGISMPNNSCRMTASMTVAHHMLQLRTLTLLLSLFFHYFLRRFYHSFFLLHQKPPLFIWSTPQALFVDIRHFTIVFTYIRFRLSLNQLSSPSSIFTRIPWVLPLAHFPFRKHRLVFSCRFHICYSLLCLSSVADVVNVEFCRLSLRRLVAIPANLCRYLIGASFDTSLLVLSFFACRLPKKAPIKIRRLLLLSCLPAPTISLVGGIDSSNILLDNGIASRSFFLSMRCPVFSPLTPLTNSVPILIRERIVLLCSLIVLTSACFICEYFSITTNIGLLSMLASFVVKYF